MSPPAIPLMRSTFFDETRTREALATFVRNAPRLSMGEQCAAFEKSFAAFQGRSHAILVNNGSAANIGLIQALLNLGRLRRGDRVGVSAVTWATNVMPLIQLGLQPVAIDCSVDHLNMTSSALYEHIGSIKALFITNALGLCGDIPAIAELCRTHDILLLEDNCESLGTRIGGTLLGNFGVASTFSFFVGHHLSTIEGGMICTDDPELAAMVTTVRAHGWDRNLPAKRQIALRKEHGIDEFHARYTFYDLAYNIRPTEITGFLGNTQLPLLDATIEKRERNFRRFREAMTTLPDRYHPLNCGHIERVSGFAMPLVARTANILRETMERFTREGVEIRPMIAGDITLHPFWKKYGLPEAVCPGARTIHECGMYAPNNPDLTDDEVSLICSLL
ncbi:MAG: DegT/DnrJ/EryC1/StrS family aminotransferase [Candidatus Peribacteraceae bacterium]|nr:DegT/DnrJ/EryC1/StrS family aminotransferase [Candidatus Peribacteraceae bacterium]